MALVQLHREKLKNSDVVTEPILYRKEKTELRETHQLLSPLPSPREVQHSRSSRLLQTHPERQTKPLGALGGWLLLYKSSEEDCTAQSPMALTSNLHTCTFSLSHHHR